MKTAVFNQANISKLSAYYTWRLRFYPLPSLLVLVTELSFGSFMQSAGTKPDGSRYVGSANYFWRTCFNPGTWRIRPNLVLEQSTHFFNRIRRVEFTWFMIAGDDAKANSDRVERNLTFSNNFELPLRAQSICCQTELAFTSGLSWICVWICGNWLLYFNPKTRYQVM